MFIKYLNENEKKINLKDIDVNNFNNLFMTLFVQITCFLHFGYFCDIQFLYI